MANHRGRLIKVMFRGKKEDMLEVQVWQHGREYHVLIKDIEIDALLLPIEITKNRAQAMAHAKDLSDGTGYPVH